MRHSVPASSEPTSMKAAAVSPLPNLTAPTKVQAPVAARHPVERQLWGESVVDDLEWLRQRDDAEVISHLEAENAYTEAALAPVAELQERLYAEIKGRIKETDLSVPVRRGGWAYYSRTEEGLAYPIHCRRAVAVDIAPEALLDLAEGGDVLLDENLEAGEAEFFDVGPFDVSPDHRLLFWGWDNSGDERYTATVRDLATGRDGEDRLEDVSHGSAWSLDGSTLFYVRPDQANRPYQVWRHRLGTAQADDVLVFDEPDERFFVGVGLEKDQSFIQVAVSSKVTDEAWVIPADEPETAPRLIAARRQGVEYAVAHRDEQFVVLTNDGGAETFKIMTTADSSPAAANWQELIAPDPAVMISDFDLIGDHLVLFERANAATRIRVRRWSDGSITEIDQPEAVSTVWPGANPEPVSNQLRYGYSSMVTPATLFSVDLDTGGRTLLKQQEVLGDFDPDRYRTKRLWAEAADGTSIPMSLVWSAERGEGPQPCLLYAYGAYEVSIDPTFSPARLSLLDRGFCFAIAHVRGGGEMGRQWYLDGKYEEKKNTFDDVVTCAHHLIDNGWTEPAKLAVRGGSAGGLTVGAVINRAPELFAAAVAQVAFVDALNTMLDADLPLTVTEWEEWGNPAESEAVYQAMRAYTPYENVHPTAYPSVLATGGLNDTRVGFWEPAKWVQVLRSQTSSDRPVLLWTDLGSGHGGPSSRYEAWREEARILAYIIGALGLAI